MVKLNPELVRAESEATPRRAFLTASAWAVPVIAVAVAAPAAAASMDTTEPAFPISCEKKPNHGHGGDTGNQWWIVTYSDGSTIPMDNGTVMSNKTLKGLCKP